MTKLVLTPKIRTAIRQAVRRVCGARRTVNVAEHRGGELNFLRFAANSEQDDIVDQCPLDDVASIDTDDRGRVALDCYAQNPWTKTDDFLDRNVYVLLDAAGVVIDANDDNLNHRERFEEISRSR